MHWDCRGYCLDSLFIFLAVFGVMEQIYDNILKKLVRWHSIYKGGMSGPAPTRNSSHRIEAWHDYFGEFKGGAAGMLFRTAEGIKMKHPSYT